MRAISQSCVEYLGGIKPLVRTARGHNEFGSQALMTLFGMFKCCIPLLTELEKAAWTGRIAVGSTIAQ